MRVVAEGSCVAARGNQFCFREEWDSAVVAYSEALQACAKVGGNLQLTSTILSNRSAACARLGQWKHSLQDAEQVVPALLEESSQSKVLGIVICKVIRLLEKHLKIDR